MGQKLTESRPGADIDWYYKETKTIEVLIGSTRAQAPNVLAALSSASNCLLLALCCHLAPALLPPLFHVIAMYNIQAKQ